MKPAKHLFYSVLYKTDSRKSFKALKHNSGIVCLDKPYLINKVKVNITIKIPEFSIEK